MFEKMNLTEFYGYEISEKKTYDWLDNFYSLWIDDEGVEQVINSAFVPAQDKNFYPFNNVFYDSNINYEMLPERYRSSVEKRDTIKNK